MRGFMLTYGLIEIGKMKEIYGMERTEPEKMKRGNEKACIISFCYPTLF